MGEERWRWQEGTVGTDRFEAAAVFEDDNSIVLAGFTTGDWNGDSSGSGSSDFAAVKIDVSGDVVWRFQEGSTGFDAFYGAAVAKDGSVVLVGSTSGDWNSTSAGGYDFAAIKLDADGSVLWRWQDGSNRADTFNCVVAAEDGSFVLGGGTQASWKGNTNAGYTDFAAVKLDADGNELWVWQSGTSENDYFLGATVVEGGSVVLAGSTLGDWSGATAGNIDFAAVKLDSEGAEVWRWQGGTSADDEIHGAAGTANDGSVVLAGVTYGDWNEKNSGFGDFAAVKLGSDGGGIWRWQEGNGALNRFNDGIMDEDGSVILGGVTEENWAGTNPDFDSSGDDFAAIKLDADGAVIWRWQGGTNKYDNCLAVAAAGTNGVFVLAGLTKGNWVGTDETAYVGDDDFAAVLLDASEITPAGEAYSSLLLTSGPTPSPFQLRAESLPGSTPSPSGVQGGSAAGVASSSTQASSSSNTSTVVAGVVGAMAAVALLVAVVYSRRRGARRRNEDKDWHVSPVGQAGAGDAPHVVIESGTRDGRSGGGPSVEDSAHSAS